MENKASIFSWMRLLPFLFAYTLIWVTGALYLMYWGYEKSFLLLNSYRHPLLDTLMPHFTLLGDGVLIPCIAALIVLPKGKDWVLCLLITLLLVSWMVQFSKSQLFPDWNRPLLTFEGKASFYYIATDTLKRFAFPSGHSAAAAAMFTFIAFAWRSRTYGPGIVFCLVSAAIAYSRLYIGVHFLGDILAGVFLGVSIACLVLWGIYPHLNRFVENIRAPKDKWVSWPLYVLVLFALFFRIYDLSQSYLQ